MEWKGCTRDSEECWLSPRERSVGMWEPSLSHVLLSWDNWG